MRTTNDTLEYDIYPNLDRAELVADHDPQDKGKYYLFTCPKCGKREAFIYKDGYTIKCNRANECKYDISVWDYVKEKKNLSQSETFKELARLAKVTLPDNHKIDTEEIERRKEKANSFEEFIGICKEELKKSKEAQKYLEGRGLTLEEALSFDIGYYPAVKTIKASFTSNTSKESITGLFSDKWEGRIVGLWKDRAGRPITVWGRTIKADGDPKYWYLYGEAKYSPYGLENCLTADVIAVEGLLDAITLRNKGLNGVIAIGSNNFPDSHIEALSKARIKTVTLNLDNDTAGIDGIERALEKLESLGIRAYVVEPSLMADAKDPDEYIRKHGIKEYQALLDQAQKGVEWKIERLKKDYSTDTAKGRDSILSEGIKYLNNVSDSITFDYGIKKLASILEMPVEIIAEKCLSEKEKKLNEDIKRDYSRLLDEAQRALPEGGTDEVDKILEERLYELKAKKVTDKVEYFSLEKLKEEGKAYSVKGKETGIKSLDKEVKIMPKELILIGARPRHGKSTIAYNIILNFLENYPEESFIFFNLDVPSTILMTRLATIWAKKHKKVSYGYKDILPHFKDDSFRKGKIKFPPNSIVNNYSFPKGEEIADAFDLFDTYGKEKRLAVVNKPEYTVEKILGHAEKLKQEKPLGAIFIDYMELIKSSTRQDTEELRISYIVNQLRIGSEKLSTPIICLAQMNRSKANDKKVDNRRPTLEGLRYSGRQEQEATTVLGLFNRTAEKMETETDGISHLEEDEDKAELEIIPLKNRGGRTNKIISLESDMKSGYIWEEQKTAYS